jgi:hypothetical protein
MSRLLERYLMAPSRWTQFQAYQGAQRSPMELMCVGVNPKVLARDGFVRLRWKEAFALEGNSSWQRMFGNDELQLDGGFEEMDYELTKRGRLIIYSRSKGRSMAVAFFEQKDSGGTDNGNPAIECVSWEDLIAQTRRLPPPTVNLGSSRAAAIVGSD